MSDSAKTVATMPIYGTVKSAFDGYGGGSKAGSKAGSKPASKAGSKAGSKAASKPGTGSLQKQISAIMNQFTKLVSAGSKPRTASKPRSGSA